MRDISLFLQPSRRSFLILALIVVLLCACAISLFVWNTPGKPVPPVHKSQPTTTTVSPLIFGTNLFLDSNTQKLSSQALQTLLEQTHVRSVRFPVAATPVPETQVARVAQVVKQVGATPLVILPGVGKKDGQATNTTIIRDMNQIFNKTPVYYEYGNENDIMGVSADQYVTAWNAEVPTLRQLAINGKFIGPVTYLYSQPYLATFLRNARPRPDAVSWHEYTCDASEPDEVCLGHIADWQQHISSARTTMQEIVKTTLPVMITEWNFAPNASNQNQKTSDSAFITTWTTQALQSMVQNQVYASMQYALMDTSTSLIVPNKGMTTQGKTFEQVYLRLFQTHQTASPTPTTGAGTTPTPALTPTTTPMPSPTATPMPSPTPSPKATPGTTPVPSPSPIPTPIPTPTPSPSQNPYPPNTGNLTTIPITTNGSWTTDSNDSGSCSFTGSSYHVRAVPNGGPRFHPCYNGFQVSNFAFEVQMTILSGDCGGLIFRSNNPHLYYLVVCSDGSYRLVRYEQEARSDTTNPVLLQSPSGKISINRNQAYSIAVVGQSNKIDLYVNRQRVDGVTDDPQAAYTRGNIGLVARAVNTSTDVVFSNAKVWTF